MSEPLVGPDAAEIEKAGPAFDGGEGAEPGAAVEPDAAEPGAAAEIDSEASGIPPVSSLSGDTDENGTSAAVPVDNSDDEPTAAEPAEAAEPTDAEPDMEPDAAEPADLESAADA